MYNKLFTDVIVDIDDVIADTALALQPIFNQECGTSICRSTWHTYFWPDVYAGLTVQRCAELLHEHDVYKHCIPIVGAIEALETMISHGAIVHLVTARGNGINDDHHTQWWLTQHNVPYHTLTLVGYPNSKYTAYRNLASNFSHIFDDGISNLHEAHDSSVVDNVIAIDTPWNVGQHQYTSSPSLNHYVNNYITMLT